MDQVDQDLFQNLAHLLGRNYFKSFRGENYLSADRSLEKEKLLAYARELLPAFEHNPILLFHLRPGVTFHDGHRFDADDVKFTYAAIMNPKNLSPRIPDFEPVKAIDVIDPLTVRIIYKRLYSPAIATWSMGILPEHLLNSQALAREALSLGKDPKTYSIRQSTFNRRPVGCGPFKFRQWKSDQYIALDRFDDYWEGPPNYQRYIYRVIPDLLTQEMEFYAGTIDSYGVQPHQVGRLKKDPKYQNFAGPLSAIPILDTISGASPLMIPASAELWAWPSMWTKSSAMCCTARVKQSPALLSSRPIIITTRSRRRL